MKALVLFAILFSVTSAHADFQFPGKGNRPERNLGPAPKVSCNVLYTSQGIKDPNDIKSRAASVEVTENGAKAEVEKFVVEGGLKRSCAADGGPCSDLFELTVEIKRGRASSLLGANVSSRQQYDRFSTALTIEGKERTETAFVNCDVNMN